MILTAKRTKSAGNIRAQFFFYFLETTLGMWIIDIQTKYPTVEIVST